MGGLFGGGGKQESLPPTPTLAPEATSVSRADVSDGETAISRMEREARRRRGYNSTMKSGANALDTSGGTKKQKLGE